MVAGFPLEPESGVEIRRRIAIMPESLGLYLRLSVRENLRGGQFVSLARHWAFGLAEPANLLQMRGVSNWLT